MELLGCIAMITGLFILFRIKPVDLANTIVDKLLASENDSIKSQVKEATGRKKISFIKRELLEIQEILKVTNRGEYFPFVCVLAIGLFTAGVFFALVAGNMFLIPVLSLGMMMIPLWYVKLTETSYKKNINQQLETSLSIITTSYLRNEDIITAVDENLEYLNNPIRSVFKEFLYKVRMVNPNIPKGLSEMKKQINNDVFREWIDGLLLCQYDRNLKTTLTPIVSKLSDIRIVNGELENMVSGPRQEFITMVVLVLSAIPILYFLNKNWYYSLVHTVVGQIVLAICFALIFVSTAKVIKITSPIEYRR